MQQLVPADPEGYHQEANHFLATANRRILSAIDGRDVDEILAVLEVVARAVQHGGANPEWSVADAPDILRFLQDRDLATFVAAVRRRQAAATARMFAACRAGDAVGGKIAIAQGADFEAVDGDGLNARDLLLRHEATRSGRVH